MLMFRVGVILVAAVALVGCGDKRGGAKGAVSGKVYVGDKVVTAGDIRFHGPNNAQAGGTIHGDGSYTVTDAPVGECKITVNPAPGMMGTKAPPKGTTAINTGGAGGVPPNPSASPPIPIAYKSVESTKLTFTVKSGTNSHDVKMTK